MPCTIRTLPVAVAALAAGSFMAGCAPDEDEAPTTGSPSASVVGQQIDVSLSEFSIDMPTSISAGPVAFLVTNDGSVEHSFDVEGEGLAEFDNNIAPGEGQTLELELEPGTYEAYCPVANHAAEGMRLEFEVTER